MELEVRRPEHLVPSYSLTGDLLAYLRCRLQYRYNNLSSLPPSRPVQLWFGEFLHGTIESCYAYWRGLWDAGRRPVAFPWPCTMRQWGGKRPAWAEHDIGRFADSVEQALLRQGKLASSRDARDSAYRRVEAGVNQLGEHLFPLIADTERRIIGTRPVPRGDTAVRCERYQVHGVIDVLTHVTVRRGGKRNVICDFLAGKCGDLVGNYEVIVDYKGSRRPLVEEPYWKQGEWQVLTYGWLRQRQPEAGRVVAGILIYINELTPGDMEMKKLKEGMERGTTDVVPAMGSRDEQLVRMWRPGAGTGQLSEEFRLRRAIHVVPVSEERTAEALREFDDVVRRTEEDVVAEAAGRDIQEAWSPTCSDQATCVACDFEPFCPRPAKKSKGYRVRAPTAP